MTGDIQMTRFPGGVRIDRADPEAAISLDLIAGSCSHLMTVHGDMITIAEQVVYRVVGYADRALQVVLVEDRRGAAT
jgi:hypothetical protein